MKNYLETGKSYFNQRDYRKALLSFEKALSSGLCQKSVHFEIGKTYYEQGKYDAAVHEFLKEIKMNPGFPYSYLMLAKAYERQGEFEEAIKEFDKALRSGRTDKEIIVQVSYEKAQIYLKQGKPDNAQEEIKKAESFDPRNEHVQRISNEIRKYKKQYTETLTELDRELKSLKGDKEKSSWIRHQKAQVYMEQEKYGLAVEEAARAVRLDPGNINAYRALGRIYMQKNEHKKALANYGKALKLARSDKKASSAVYSEIAQVYLEDREYGLAIENTNKAIANNKYNEYAYRTLGNIYVEKKEYEKALSWYNKALSLAKGDKKLESALYSEIAQVYSAQEKNDLALDTLKKAARIDINNGYAYGILGSIYKQKKEYEKALAEYGKAKELIKGDNKVRSIILSETAQVYLELGRYVQAKKEFDKALCLGLDDEHLHNGMGRIYIEQGKYIQAADEFNKAIKINPSIEGFLRLTKVYKKLHKFDSCIDSSVKYVEFESENDLENNKAMTARWNNGRKDDPLKIKIIRTPFFLQKTKVNLNYSLILPLGMGQIVSYLRKNGLKLDQDDLYIKINHDNKFGTDEKKIDEDVFLDEKRITEYSNGKADEYIESIMKKVEKRSKLSGYNVILLSLFEGFENSSASMFVLAFTRYIKKKYDPFIVIGGSYPAIDALLKFNTQNIDVVVKGQGEKILVEILTALQNKMKVSDIPGISLSPDGRVVEAKQAMLGLNPDFDGLPVNLYRHENLKVADCDEEISNIVNDCNNKKIMVATLQLMEGCFYECIFCGSSQSEMILSLNPKTAVKNLKSLKEKYGVKCFFFVDNAINLSKKYLNEFCDEIISQKLDILWCDCARVNNLDKPMLLKLRKAGCVRLIYGMESASPNLLKYIDKRISLEQLKKVISWTDEAGIWVGLEVISGFPHETREDVEMTINFINQNRKHINTVYYNALYLHKNSKLYQYPEKYGIKNIREVDRCKPGQEGPLSSIRHGYDEMNGLKWNDKLERMIETYDHVFKSTQGGSFGFPFYDNEHFIFYLYSKYKSKDKIVNTYNKVREAVGGQKEEEEL